MLSLDLYAVASVYPAVIAPGFWAFQIAASVRCWVFTRLLFRWWHDTNLVDPASSHMLVSKIKPCMSQYKLLYGETANGSLKQL